MLIAALWGWQWVEHNGRRWPKDVAAVVQGILPGCKLYLRSKLLGGGGDGGSTGAESRSSYLEMYQDKKPDKVTRAVLLGFCWPQQALLLCHALAVCCSFWMLGSLSAELTNRHHIFLKQ